jgi:hypothetical protein
MWHPDRNAHTVELARRKFEEIKIALDILSDETLRNQYDLKQVKSVHGCRRALLLARPARWCACNTRGSCCSSIRVARFALHRAASRCADRQESLPWCACACVHVHASAPLHSPSPPSFVQTSSKTGRSQRAQDTEESYRLCESCRPCAPSTWPFFGS